MTAHTSAVGENDSVLKAIRDGLVDELIESESRFRAIATNMVDPLLVFSERGTIDFSNLAAEQLFRCGPQELIGQNVRLFLPRAGAEEQADGPRKDASDDAYAEIGVAREGTGKRADGLEFPLEISLSNVTVNGRRWFVGLLRDLTERRQLEQQLRAAEQAALADSDRKSEFLRAMNHHLRTPLTPILGYAELLLDEKLTDHQRELVAGIQRNAQQLFHDVSSLLDMTYPFDFTRLPVPHCAGHQADDPSERE